MFLFREIGIRKSFYFFALNRKDMILREIESWSEHWKGVDDDDDDAVALLVKN
jgi:hypothetical protein